MNVSLVMTVIGRDRPGLVDSVAAIVAQHGGNWLESRMSRLGGQFAGILRVEAGADQAPVLVDSLKQLDAQGLTVVVKTDPTPPTQPRQRLMNLEIVGQDRPGIVRQISLALAGHGVNVEELHTGCSSAAMSGEILFHAEAQVHVPDSCDLARLRQDLEKIAADLIVDVSFGELEGDATATAERR